MKMNDSDHLWDDPSWSCHEALCVCVRTRVSISVYACVCSLLPFPFIVFRLLGTGAAPWRMTDFEGKKNLT